MNESEIWKLLQEGANLLEVRLDAASMSRFQQYSDLLQSKNKEFNLTAITNPREIVAKLYLDSLSLLGPIADILSLTVMELQHQAYRAVDIGSGAGIPGIPLCIACPKFRFSLIEAKRKKGIFLTRVIFSLDLNASILLDRAESLGQDAQFREQYDLVFARAVAPLPILAELTIPFAKLGGIIALPKGPMADDEIKKALPAIGCLGADLITLQTLDIPYVKETRKVILLKKVTPTPHSFPRRPGIPKKRPLS